MVCSDQGINTTIKKGKAMTHEEPLGKTSIHSDGCEDWADTTNERQLICWNEGSQFIPEEWADGRDVAMSVFRGSRIHTKDHQGAIQYYFIRLDEDRIMIKEPEAEEWKLECVYDALSLWLREDCGCEHGKTYSVVFMPVARKPITVTKRRRLVIDVEVDVELDDAYTPRFSPGKMLYEAGLEIFKQLRECPHTSNITPMHWNVDHVQIGSPYLKPVIVDKNNEEYLKYKDQPGLWDCDRVNGRWGKQ